jgi:DNA-binding SARP family transcriptional activator
MDLPKLWAQITADLEQARSTLLNDAANDKAIFQYKEFLSHNELELACDMLESYAETHTVNREFWLALRDAAAKMELYDRSRRYERFANPPETTA